MKTLSLIAIQLCFTFLTYAQKGTLTISIEKHNNLDGKIYVGIFTEDNFLLQPILSSETELSGKIATAVFEDLEYGTFAISAYQDVNGNDQLDRGQYGRPTEPWVISGSPASMMPIWMDAKFDFTSKEQMVKLKI